MTGPADRPIRKFNPGTFQSDMEVTKQFVVRNHELSVLLDVLRGNIEAASCQHALIVAPRGRGKTMLLARVAAEIRTTPELATHLLPVRFMEESQEIFSLTDFWLETLFHLARECASHDSGLAEELRDRHASLSERWREQALEERAQAAVLDAADRLDRRLVLMVENLQALCKDVDQDFGWKLRGVLQTEPQIMLLASATSRFTGLDDVEQPFFEMFRIISLRPLTTEECRSLWEVVSGDRVSGREMRPLEILTSGSPRLMVIVAGFARHRPLRRLMEELVMLIDEHTEYFRGHLEVLGKTERRVYIAVLDLWQLSTPGEIAARARMDVRVVSTMLGRLVDRGTLVVEGSGRKKNYAAAEPLYCIYYKLRRGRGETAIVESLIRFMSVFYSEVERTEIFSALMFEGADSPTMRPGLERAAAGLPEFARFLAGIEPDRGALGELGARAAADAPDYDSIKRLLRKISTASDQEAFETVVDIVDRSVTIQNPAPHRVSQAFSAWALNMKGDAHAQLGDPDSALSAYDAVVERFGGSKDSWLQGRVGRALKHKGHALRDGGDLVSALAAYKEVVERFRGNEDLELKQSVAEALHFKGDCLRELGNLDSALLTYEEIVERFADKSDVELQRWVASALTSKGYVQSELGDLDSAVSTYEEVIQRFGTTGHVELERCIALPLHRKGCALLDLGDPESALAAFDEFLERFGSSEDPELWPWVALATIDKTVMLIETGRTQDALCTCEEFESRLRGLDDERKHELTWQARQVWTRALLAQQDLPAATEKFRSLHAAFVPSDDTMMREASELIPEMIAGGASAHELLDILSSNAEKAAALAPLVVALRQHTGEIVREPEAILQVAADIRKRIQEEEPTRSS